MENKHFVSDIEHFVYVKLQLLSKSLSEDSRSMLESVGVECLDQGGEFEAYGIVSPDATMVSLLSKLPGIQNAELEAPPTGI